MIPFSLKQFWNRLAVAGYTRTIGILAILVLALSVPLTIIVLQQQTNIQQKASPIGSVIFVDQNNTPITQTAVPDVRLQLAPPDGWVLAQAPKTSLLAKTNIVPNANAQTPSPPGAPTNVTATAGNASATVSWTTPASDGGSPITLYYIYIYLDSANDTSAPYVSGTIINCPCPTLSATITGLTNGTSYKSAVLAYSVRRGEYSDFSNIFTPSGSTITPTATPTPVTERPSPCNNFGDINNDGVVSQADAELIFAFINTDPQRHRDLTAEQQRRADVDADGGITVGDASVILNYIDGDLSTFPACSQPPAATWTPTPTSTPPVTQRPSPCDNFGDVNQDGVVSRADGDLIVSFLHGNQTLTAEQQRRANVNASLGVEIIDAQLILLYATNQLATFPACSPVSGTPTASPIPTPTPFNTLFKIVIKNDDSGSGGDAETTITSTQEIAAALATPIPWKINPLLDTDGASGIRNVQVTYFAHTSTGDNSRIAYASITLVNPSITPVTERPSPCPNSGNFGDINNDGVVSHADADLISDFVRTGPTHRDLTAEQQRRANVNADGGIDIADVQAILNYIDGDLSTFIACSQPPAPSWTPTPTATVTPTFPGAPGTPTATPGNASATVSWTAPASDGGSPITRYYIYIFLGSAQDTSTPAVNSATINCPCPTLSTTITRLTNGTPYKFKAVAENSVGQGFSSAFSNIVTPSGPTATPTLTPSPTGSTAPRRPGDANGDGRVDGADYSIWLRQFHNDPTLPISPTADADFNDDGRVTLIDYNMWNIPYLGL